MSLFVINLFNKEHKFKMIILVCVQANGIKIGQQHSPTNPSLPGAGNQAGSASSGCC